MIMFDKVVNAALKNQPKLMHLRSVVEKEILHHDILLAMRNAKLLTHLTFIGGTCLRACYGGVRLSEDLDFTGGLDFNRGSLIDLGRVITSTLKNKYELNVQVSEPKKDTDLVDTWKIRIETREASKHLPTQRINIDICALKSYDISPQMILNPYGVDFGTSGLVVNAQSLEEIYTDKLIAFALRPNRIKYRDIWDISWCHSKNIIPTIDLIPFKIKDRKIELTFFLEEYKHRVDAMGKDEKLIQEFKTEMRRFLTPEYTRDETRLEDLWKFTSHLLKNFYQQMFVL
ncbi:MAG TPA: nucleotidyl transferase AbiEii/AbiGii toxin family protein [Holosporales bacterium]|nr:nucleotidyl transferase AbiEii/AbiGii toxin family protein [Holosporales bacterium]